MTTEDHIEESVIPTTNLISLISDPIDVAISRHSQPGEDPTWMAGLVVLPSPDGQGLQFNQYVTISVTTPILGAAPPSATTVLDLRQIRDEVVADRLVVGLLEQARELQSQMLAEASPEKSPYNFSDLIKGGPPE